MLFLIYALTEFYFTAVNLIFILGRSNFKRKFMKYKLFTFIIPLGISIAVNSILFIFGIYNLVERVAVEDQGFGQGLIYVILVVPSIAIFRDILFFQYYRIIGKIKDKSCHLMVNVDNLEIMPVTNGYYIIEKEQHLL